MKLLAVVVMTAVGGVDGALCLNGKTTIKSTGMFDFLLVSGAIVRQWVVGLPKYVFAATKGDPC